VRIVEVAYSKGLYETAPTGSSKSEMVQVMEVVVRAVILTVLVLLLLLY
jgi:hypothetical protein